MLPYHAMGEAKYRELGISYSLAGMQPLARSEAEKAKNHILEGIREVIRHK